MTGGVSSQDETDRQTEMDCTSIGGGGDATVPVSLVYRGPTTSPTPSAWSAAGVTGSTEAGVDELLATRRWPVEASPSSVRRSSVVSNIYESVTSLGAAALLAATTQVRTAFSQRSSLWMRVALRCV